MTRLSGLAALLLAVVPVPALAGDADPLELEAAIATALRESQRLAAADVATGIAEARAQEVRGGLLPRVDLSEIYSRSTNPALVFRNLLGQEAFGPENFLIETLNEPDPLGNFETRLDIYQPLWTGGRVGRARDVARTAHEASLAARDRTRQEVIQQVVEAYAGAVMAAAHAQAARRSRETARAHVALVRDLREAGLVVESDLLEARVRESEVEEMVILAESGLEVARAGLNLAMGLPPSSPLALPSELAPPAVELERLDDLVAEALERRPDLRAARHQVEAADGGRRAARADLLPQLGFAGSVEANDPDAPGTQGTNWTAMAVLRVPLYDGATRSRIRQAEGQRRQAEEQAEMLQHGVALEVTRAWHGIRAAEERLEEARRAADLGTEALRVVEDRYREGLATVVELLGAEASLTRARARGVAAQRDLLVSRATLDLAVGRL